MKYTSLTAKRLGFALILLMTLQSCQTMKQNVDLILINGKVYTVNEAFDVAEAFAVKDGKFVAVGTTKEILATYQSEFMHDADGQAVYPGLIDGHCHFYGFGENLYRYANLAGTKSFAEVIERLEKHSLSHPSEWLLGRGWDHNNWEIKEFPDNDLLEKYFPEKKILLIRVDGHATLASKAALKAAGIDANTRVPGGEVLLNKNGQPTGVLIDNADLAVKALVPKLTEAEKTSALLEAQEKCFAVGLSSVVDAGLPFQTIELIRKLQDEGQLKMKINAMIDPDDATLDFYLPGGKQFSERLSITAVKMYADGALGSRGAKLIEPYSDEITKTGLILHENDFYTTIAQRAYDAGFQVNMHAIGDSAVRFVLELYTDKLKEKNDRRWRIEHSQVVAPDDFEKFEKFSIIPSIQSTHATSDMRWAIDRLGEERIKGAYAQQELLAQNGWIVNGTDFPIEGINPINTFYAAVFRKDETGYPEDGFQMENALSREQALRSMTIWAAKGNFEEQQKGSIESGKFADFVILNQDIMETEEKRILETKVLTLYISGERVYRAE
jgi:predicted amidohydrolase YtcJ